MASESQHYLQEKGTMKKLSSVLGYGWAVITIFIVLATFLGNSYFSKKLAGATGVTVSPWFAGGEVAQVVEHGAYRTSVHRPVFDGLTGERSDGFLQVDWKPAAGLPPLITESVALPNGERISIRLDTATGTATVASNGTTLLGLERAYKLRDGWAVRLLLRNPGRTG